MIGDILGPSWERLRQSWGRLGASLIKGIPADPKMQNFDDNPHFIFYFFGDACPEIFD